MILHLSPRTRQKYRLIQVPNREKGKLEAEDLRRRRKRSLRSVGAPRRFEFGQIGSNVCNLSVLPSAAFHAAGLPAEISNKPGARSDERSNRFSRGETFSRRAREAFRGWSTSDSRGDKHFQSTNDRSRILFLEWFCSSPLAKRGRTAATSVLGFAHGPRNRTNQNASVCRSTVNGLA